MVLSKMYIISLLIVSIIIGGGSSTEGITITTNRNFTCTINNTNRRTVIERLRLFRNTRVKEIAIFHTDKHENCKAWADIDKCKQTESMMLNCDEQGVRCEKISCRRSCDIVLLPTINEAPCKKKQRREWYDDLREEYLDHLNPRNVLRTEALFKILFFGKAHDIIIEHDDENMKNNVLKLLNNDERSSFFHERREVSKLLVAIGGQDYVNYYNLMIYYLNIATGKGGVEYEYVATLDLSTKRTVYESFSLVYGDLISELIKEIYEDDDEVEVTWPPLGEWNLSLPKERRVSISTILSKARFEFDLNDGLLSHSENVIDYVLRKGMLSTYGDSEEFTPSFVEAGSSKVRFLASELEIIDQLEPPCTRAIKQWLDDRREYFIAWKEKHPTLIRQVPFLFQGFFIGKMIDLVVPEVHGERFGEGYISYSFTKLSFPKVNDTEKRDRISAYMLSLLSNEERTNLLRDLDKIERKISRIDSLNIKQLGFDFNNLMEYFLNYYPFVKEAIVEEEEEEVQSFDMSNNTLRDQYEDERGIQSLLDKVKSLKLNEKFEEAIVVVLFCFVLIASLCILPFLPFLLAVFKDELDYCLITIFGFIGRMIRVPYDRYWEKRIQTTLYVRSSMSKKLAGKLGLESSSKNISSKQGRKKNRFLNKSGVDDIQIDTAATGSSYVAVHLTGSRRSIKKAVAMIQEAVGAEHISQKRINQSSHSNPMQEESFKSALIDDNDTSTDDQGKHHLTTVDDDDMSRKIDRPSQVAPPFAAEQSTITFIICETFRNIFISICSILRRGMKCLVVIPRMIYISVGMMIRLPFKLIRGTIGKEHASIDQPSNSSPQQVEAPRLVMSPSSAITSVDEKKIISMEQKASPTPMRKEEIPSEIGFDSSQVLTCGTITETSMSDLNGVSNTKADSEFSLNDNDPFLIFLRSQHQCIRGNVDEFYIWLVKSEYIDSISALKEAVCDDVYYNDTMKVGSGRSGIKVFKRREFQRAVLEFEVLDDDQSLSQYESKASNTNLSKPPSKNTILNEPPEELVCPISLSLMTNDPVVAADGITYERASIEDWFEKSKAKISEAQGRMRHNPHSEADQRVVDNGVCSPVYGIKLESLVVTPNTSVRNMARAYKEKKKEVH